jgi:hypothetical protein
LWRPEHSPATVIVARAPEDFTAARSIDPDRQELVIQHADTENGRHVLLDDPEGRHRIWLVENVHARAGSAFLVPFDDDFGARLHSLQRLHRRLIGKRAGPPLRSLQLSPTQRARLTLLVRALDGEQEGVSRREIAAVLLDAEARHIPAIEWKNAALRKRVNRVVASSVALMSGGYLALLRGDPTRAQRFRRP